MYLDVSELAAVILLPTLLTGLSVYVWKNGQVKKERRRLERAEERHEDKLVSRARLDRKKDKEIQKLYMVINGYEQSLMRAESQKLKLTG